MPLNNSDGIRMSTALTYINPSRHRLNLTIRPKVLARRISCSMERGPRGWKWRATGSGS